LDVRVTGPPQSRKHWLISPVPIQPKLRRPVSLRRRIRPEEEPRVRGTLGVKKGPAGLDASRHQGLSRSCVLAFRSGSRPDNEDIAF